MYVPVVELSHHREAKQTNISHPYFYIEVGAETSANIKPNHLMTGSTCDGVFRFQESAFSSRLFSSSDLVSWLGKDG